MLRGRRTALSFLLCGSLLAGAAFGPVAAVGEDPPQYWLGPYFGGMRLTYVDDYPGPTGKSFGYGDCELPEGEGGCSIPVDIQNTTTCDRNPLAIDRVPFEVFPLRGGGLAVQYESTAIDIGTGHRTVTLYANYELVGAALRELRAEGDTEPQPLAPPVYPMPALRELKRVTVAAQRFGGIGAISRAIHVAPEEVRVRLRIAELLGPEALADVPPPKMSIATLERLRQLAFSASYEFARTAREHGLTKAELRKKVDRVRGLVGFC